MKFFFTASLVLTICISGIAQHYSDSISVNFFLLDECRISQNISGEINYVYEHYNKAPFSFKGYFPNLSSTKEGISDFMDHYGITLPYETDYSKDKATLYEATIAPEVVVYDEKLQAILYKGRIDNSYDKVGVRRRVVTSRDLRTVLDAILAKQEISNPQTQAIGCYINFNESN